MARAGPVYTDNKRTTSMLTAAINKINHKKYYLAACQQCYLVYKVLAVTFVDRQANEKLRTFKLYFALYSFFLLLGTVSLMD